MPPPLLLLWSSSMEYNALQTAGTATCQRHRKNILEDGLWGCKNATNVP